MVKSMNAAIAGLKSHQTKMDVLSNNIANVNTWGFKSRTTNFQDALYSNSISGSAGKMENGKLGMVKEFQDRLYGSRYIATDLSGDPDFVKLVEAYGIKAARAKNNEEARKLAKEMLEYDGSYVLVCNVDPNTPTL